MDHVEFLEKLHDLTFNKQAGFSAMSDTAELLEKHVARALDDAYQTRQKAWRLENKAINARRVRAVRRAAQ